MAVVTGSHDQVDLQRDQFGDKRWEALVFPLRPPILDDDVPPLDVAEFAQALAEWPHTIGLEGRCRVPEESDLVSVPYRLRLGNERCGEEQNGDDKGDRRAHANELRAAIHSVPQYVKLTVGVVIVLFALSAQLEVDRPAYAAA